MLKQLHYVWLCLPLLACQVSEEKPPEVPQPLPTVAPVTEPSPPKAEDDAEVKALFAQKLIDPLTQYLEKYQGKTDKQQHLALVREERDQRCEKIAAWYAKKAATEENLQRLKGGYAYSCLPLVESFAQRVASAEAAAEETQADTPKPQTAADNTAEQPVVAETAQKPVAEPATSAQPVESKAEPTPQTSPQTDPEAACQQSMAQKNYAQIAQHCPPLAQQGDVKAQLLLAKMYADGKGVVQSDQQAVKWYQMAAEQGDKTAQSALGVSYYTGNGVTQDYRKAASWQRKAANQGHPDAQFILGVMYELGQGVPQDFVLAYKWFLLAASQGAKGAMESRSSLAAKLSPTQIQEGQRLAREWSQAN